MTDQSAADTVHPIEIRHLDGVHELELFCQLPYVLNDELAGDLAAGRRRPEWMWMAVRGERLLARVAWWGTDAPHLLDVFDLSDRDIGLHIAPNEDPAELGARLLQTATAAVIDSGTRPEYIRFASPKWRDDAAEHDLVASRMAAMERTGARLFVERLRLRWLPATPVPDSSGRLTFRPVSGRDELLELMTAVLEGTLDAHSRADLERRSAADSAAGHFEEFTAYPSPAEWWTVAEDEPGQPVGFVIPAHNAYGPIIAYLGVLPGSRGRGYVDDLLAEGTRILASHGAVRIQASTDLDNVPMAQAFARAGYVDFERCITMTWPDPS